ncbi:BolA family protein [Candidatus Anaplasma sp. TIGMIC]|uniref:BolA family protein n=1 Tax=Candidatus Anaplasma sp. TIGMIC TaxID=3020713 RepID=UPI00232E4E4F|nr:BolA family protein [Candidatus Anaplasma sp. TIGMIC]MDB1135370.1 BolA family transcriptional regulator [Candidatus Anaplasma sp. TIGMIC]
MEIQKYAGNTFDNENQHEKSSVTSSDDNDFSSLCATIKSKVTSRIGNAHIEIIDESYKHAGHAGSSGYTVSHIRMTVISDYFNLMNKLQRHRLLHQILESEFKKVHSITFHLVTEKEAAF